MRRARPGSPRVFEPLVELVSLVRLPHIIASVCGPTSPAGLRRAFFLSMPPSIGCQRHRHENGASYLTSALVPPTPRLLDESRHLLPLFLGISGKFSYQVAAVADCDIKLQATEKPKARIK